MEQRYPRPEVPAFRLEGKFPVESPPETREQKTKQDAPDGQSLTSAVICLYESTSDLFAPEVNTPCAVYLYRCILLRTQQERAVWNQEARWLAARCPRLSLAKLLSRRTPLRGKG